MMDMPICAAPVFPVFVWQPFVLFMQEAAKFGAND
jgi:hypothetical protein